MTSATCPRCSSDIGPDARFCPSCGASVSAAVPCPRCGAAIEVGRTFCGACGQNVNLAAQLAPPPPVVFVQGQARQGAAPHAGGRATTAMVLGIVGLFSLFLPLLTPASIIALVLGGSARKKLTAVGAETGSATAGVVMGVVGIALGAIGFLIGIAMLAYMEERAARQPEVILVDPLWWLW